MNKKSNNATKISIEVLHDFFKDINTQNVNDELNDIFDTTYLSSCIRRPTSQYKDRNTSQQNGDIYSAGSHDTQLQPK